MTSQLYASRVTGSVSGDMGAARPVYRVTAMSNVCQKWCTGLILPEKSAANRSRSCATWDRIRQYRLMSTGS